MGYLVAALSGAGGEEVFEDESVGHCCYGRLVMKLCGLWICGRNGWWLVVWLLMSLNSLCVYGI